MWIDGWYPYPDMAVFSLLAMAFSPKRGALFECVCKDAEEAHRLCEDRMMRPERY